MAPMGEDGNLQPYSNMLQRRPLPNTSSASMLATDGQTENIIPEAPFP